MYMYIYRDTDGICKYFLFYRSSARSSVFSARSRTPALSTYIYINGFVYNEK